MSFRPLLVLALGALLSPLALGQGGGQVWVPLVVGVPPGKPAEVALDEAASTAQATLVDVRIFGFWKQDVLAPNGTVYQRIEVPGLWSYGKQGAPALPVVRMRLANATNGGNVQLSLAQELAVSNVPNMNIYPQPVLGDDEEPFDPTGNPGPGDPIGTSEQFYPPDPVIYGMAANWPPAADTGPYKPDPYFEAFSEVSPQAHPVYWNPVTKNLKVVTHLTLRYVHGGSPQSTLNIAKPKHKFGKFTFLNWAAVQNNYLVDLASYHARYLVLTRDMYLNELNPLINLKKMQGFQVVLATKSGNWTAVEIIAEIAAFYAAGGGDASTMDHYCLLVGDTVEVPMRHYSHEQDGVVTVIPTDDLYGSLGVISTDEKVFVGRLSVDNEADLTRQVDKIVDYQISPQPGGGYHNALMVAHLEGSPGKYQGAHNQVVAASYSHPPTFITCYAGSGNINADVSSWINQGVGVVAYRGHGSTNAWSSWNLLGESYHKNDVIALMNFGTHPVVWAITCTNANIEWSAGTSSDSIAEAWMESTDRAGSASYGATITTSTEPNHELDRALFRAVYDHGITTHAHAIAFAEEAMLNAFPGTKNPWAYLLLGDPAMHIRRDQAADIQLTGPDTIEPCDTPDCTSSVSILAKTATGAPAVGALVSLWKPSAIPGQSDEVLVNGYANSDGFVSLPVKAFTPGPLHVCVQDDDGNLSLDTITVSMQEPWTDLGHALPGTLGAPSLVGLGPLTPNSTIATVLSNVFPNTLATLVLGFSAVNAPFKGGVWVPAADVLVAGLPTGPQGVIHLPTTWPSGVPAGFSFYLQYWMQDPAGPQGFAASNALKATSP